MSRLFTATAILMLILALAVPAFAREGAPGVIDGTSNTMLGAITDITDGTSNTIMLGVTRGFILPYIEQDN